MSSAAMMDKFTKDVSTVEKGVPVHFNNDACVGNISSKWRIAFVSIAATAVVLYTGFHHCHTRPQERHPSAALENLFLSIPNESSALATSRSFATHPHLAASKEDLKDAIQILSEFQGAFGIPQAQGDPLPIFEAGSALSRNATLNIVTRAAKEPTAWIDKYYPLMQTAIDHSLVIVDVDGKIAYNASLEEVAEEGDEEAHRYKDAVSAWHGYSGNGTASGHLVYVNLGRKEDYDTFSDDELKDKIVIVRYGGIFRGLKVKGAEDRGAAGVLIYSDPRDDGVTVEDGYAPYPAGPARNPSSVQRGSVQYLSVYPGDPTTPGYPAYENATRVGATNMPRIPSLPISWKTAERLLEELHRGDQAVKSSDSAWTSWGSSDSTITFVNNVENKVSPIWNTMAAIPGHVRDEVILIGCHRDAWVMGAADPTSGTVSLLEAVRAFGHLYAKGWRPMRTIVFASWDAEEYGLVGSTEYGEDYAEWIKKHLFAYLNVDVSVSGSRFHASGSPSIAHLFRDVALKVGHPTDPSRSLWDARNDSGPFVNDHSRDPTVKAFWGDESDLLHVSKAQGGVRIKPLGSGSDFTVFLQHLGVASSDEGFGLTSSDAVYHYHSIYDSQHWQEVYGDPGFHRHVAVAKHLGLMALRLTDSIVLPLNTTQYSIELFEYLEKVEALDSPVAPDFKTLRKSLEKLKKTSIKLDKEKQVAERAILRLLRKLPKRNSQCDQQWLQVLTKWMKLIFGVQTLSARSRSPSISCVTLEDAYNYINHDIDAVPQTLHGFPIKKFIKAAKRVQVVNQRLKSFEAGLIDEAGIKDRTWYRHLGVAAGKWTGYGATTLPGLTEALVDDKDGDLAKYETERLVAAIKKMTTKLSPV